MDRGRQALTAGGVVAALLLGATAVAQVQQALRPRPVETTLAPSRVDNAALAQARQSPLAARLRTVLANDKDAIQLFSQARSSAVPVLGPPDPALLRTARFYPGDRQYTLVVRRPGQIIEILGSTRALQAPDGAVLPTRQPAPPVLTRGQRQTPLSASIAQAQARGLSNIQTERTEYGVDVSFGRFGAVYNVTFICDVMTSLECSDAAAVQFASDLELIGGGQ